MRRFFHNILLTFGLCLFGLGANAQIWDRGSYPDDPYSRNRGIYRDDDGYSRRRGPYGPYRDNRPYQNGRYGRNAGSIIDQVQYDIQRAAANSRVDGHERKHFDNAIDNLRKFQDRWTQGKFDQGRLDKAIDNLQHLVDADQVRGRDRSVLAQDLDALRDFRANRGRYSNGRYGYEDGYYRNDRRYDPYGYGR